MRRNGGRSGPGDSITRSPPSTGTAWGRNKGEGGKDGKLAVVVVEAGLLMGLAKKRKEERK